MTPTLPNILGFYCKRCLKQSRMNVCVRACVILLRSAALNATPRLKSPRRPWQPKRVRTAFTPPPPTSTYDITTAKLTSEA